MQGLEEYEKGRKNMEGIIEQLESLKAHCQSMVDENDPECIWAADCEALAAAIETLRDDEFRKRDGRVKMKLKKEIKRLNKMLAPGVEWSDQKLKKAHINLRKWLKELKEYRKLEKQGWLLKLPCVVGDTIYFLEKCEGCEGWRISKGVISNALIRDTEPPLFKIKGSFGRVRLEAFGRTVFLTRQEAEEALERMKGEGA